MKQKKLMVGGRLARILALPADRKGCGFYRILLPMSTIKDLGLAEVELSSEWNKKAVEWADLIVIQRASIPQFYELFEEARAMGKIIIYEIDDLLYGLHSSNPAYEAWSPQSPKTARALRLMGMANHVTVTTNRLANEYMSFNKNIFVLPNCLSSEQWEESDKFTKEMKEHYEKRKNDKFVRIGYTVSASHKDDVEMIADILTTLSKKHKNVKISILGYDARYFLHKIPLAEATCPHCGEGGQLELIKGVDILDYPSYLRAQAFDIGIAPLVETGFNQCRSDLKAKEYGALSIPVVASNIKPYSESVENGVTGFLATSGKEWVNALETLIVDKKKREQMGKANYDWYKKNTIELNINKWINAYEKALNRSFSW